MEILLNIRNLSKIYINQKNPIAALDNVSLDIYQGEIISLLGANGAGKTTLSSIIATLHPPSSGDIIWNDYSIYKQLMEYRNAVGFCPQKPNLDKILTVEQNLFFAGRYLLMPLELIKRRVSETIEQFDLGAYAHSSISVLSGGYLQRLLIARALIHDPMLIIFDEPTVGLDPHIRRQLWNHILMLKQAGKTIILTTHYIDEAETLSDRVCILDKGRIRLIDTPKNLMSIYNKNKLEEVLLQLAQEPGEQS